MLKETINLITEDGIVIAMPDVIVCIVTLQSKLILYCDNEKDIRKNSIDLISSFY